MLQLDSSCWFDDRRRVFEEVQDFASGKTFPLREKERQREIKRRRRDGDEDKPPIDDGYHQRRTAIGRIATRDDRQNGNRRDCNETSDGLVPVVVAPVPHKNDVEQRRIVDGPPRDNITAPAYLQSHLSDFQISLWHLISGVRFVQGGAYEERQGICE